MLNQICTLKTKKEVKTMFFKRLVHLLFGRKESDVFPRSSKRGTSAPKTYSQRYEEANEMTTSELTLMPLRNSSTTKNPRGSFFIKELKEFATKEKLQIVTRLARLDFAQYKPPPFRPPTGGSKCAVPICSFSERGFGLIQEYCTKKDISES